MDTPRCNCSSRNSHRKAAIEPGLPSLSLLLARKPDRLLANELYLENLYTFKSGLEPVAKRIDRIEQHSQFFSLPEPNSGNCIGPRPTADDSGTCHPAIVGYEDALAGQIERSRRDACHSTPPTPAYAKFRRQQLQGRRRPSLLQAHRTRFYGASRAWTGPWRHRPRAIRPPWDESSADRPQPKPDRMRHQSLSLRAPLPPTQCFY